MNITFFPSTRLGKWSVILIGVFLIFLLITVILVFSGQANSESGSFFDPWWSGPIMVATWVPGVGAFINGLVGILGYKERSALVFLSSLLGGIALVFITALLLGPH